MEGRLIYDCFVLNEKADAVYYHGSQPVLKDLIVVTAATDTGKSTILVNPDQMDGVKRYYDTAATADALTAVTQGTAITTSAWTELTASGQEITPAADDKFVRVVEVDGSDMPVAVGTAVLNIG